MDGVSRIRGIFAGLEAEQSLCRRAAGAWILIDDTNGLYL
jgi:hypothetical protein